MKRTIKFSLSFLALEFLLLLILPFSIFAMDMDSDMDMDSELKVSPHITVLNLSSNPTGTLTATYHGETVAAKWNITMEASVTGEMSGTISLATEGDLSETATVTALSPGTATVEAEYNGLTSKAMIMIETANAPEPPDYSTGKLVLGPHLTVLDLDTKPTATISAYLELDGNDTYLVPVAVSWEISMQASIDGKPTGVVDLITDGTTGENATVKALTTGTATVKVTYGDQTAMAMVMVNTQEHPEPAKGKLVLEPNLTVLDLNTKPTATISAYLQSGDQEAYLVPVEVEWDITMQAQTNGETTGVINIVSNGETATIEALSTGTATVRAMYNDQMVMAMVMSEDLQKAPTIDVTDINLSSDKIYLSTTGQKSQEISATLLPEGSEGIISWSCMPSSVATVTSTGNNTAIINAVSEGIATVTAQVGNVIKTAQIEINNKEFIISDFQITATSPDYFTVEITPEANPAINANVDVAQVSMFAWSETNQSDIDAKVAGQNGNTFSYTFPVNNNGINNYFNKADDILLNIYASSIPESNGNLLAVAEYSWINELTNGGELVAYIGYSQNVGFDKPTVYSGIAGTEDQNCLEGLRISSSIADIEINAAVHVEDFGWQDAVGDGVYAGTMGLNKQIESIVLTLTGTDADNYEILYRVNQEEIGWSDWVSSGVKAGVTGRNLSLNAYEVQLVEK